MEFGVVIAIKSDASIFTARVDVVLSNTSAILCVFSDGNVPNVIATVDNMINNIEKKDTICTSNIMMIASFIKLSNNYWIVPYFVTVQTVIPLAITCMYYTTAQNRAHWHQMEISTVYKR